MSGRRSKALPAAHDYREGEARPYPQPTIIREEKYGIKRVALQSGGKDCPAVEVPFQALTQPSGPKRAATVSVNFSGTLFWRASAYTTGASRVRLSLLRGPPRQHSSLPRAGSRSRVVSGCLSMACETVVDSAYPIRYPITISAWKPHQYATGSHSDIRPHQQAQSHINKLGVVTFLVSSHASFRIYPELFASPDPHGLAARSFVSSPSQSVWPSQRFTVSACRRFSPSSVSPVSTDPRF